MRTDWQAFLVSQGGRIEHGRLLDFGDPEAERSASGSAAILTELSHFGLLSCSGADAAAFLHGQLSNDVKALTPATSMYAAYCLANGRMLASLLVWQLGDGFALLLPAEILASVQQRLSMFLMRSKARLEDVSDAHVRLGVAGPEAAKILQEIFHTVPSEPHQVVQHPIGTLNRLEQDRFVLSLQPDAAPAIWQALAARCTAVGSARWNWLDIHAGIPWLGQATQGQFIPQMANLELIGGVSFKKGCYPGQEVVARTQYLGKIKRRMVLANIDSHIAPVPGDTLFGTDNQAGGVIVNAEAAPDGGYDVLAVVQTAGIDCCMHLHGLLGPVLNILPLPYAV